MNSEEIRNKFEQIADLATNPEYAALIRQLGELMYARLKHTTDVHNAIDATVRALHEEFQELSVLLTTRLKDTERVYADRIDQVIDRTHTLANRFMAVEAKVDETVELLDARLDEILAAIKQSK